MSVSMLRCWARVVALLHVKPCSHRQHEPTPWPRAFFFELEYSSRSSTNHSAIYHLQHNDDEKRHVKKEKEDVVRFTPP